MPTTKRTPPTKTAPHRPTVAPDELKAAGPDELTVPLEGVKAASNGLGRERVVDIQRARMLAAMFDVVCERGAGGASVAHVVSRSGVSRRTFYESFEDREDCFLAAFDEAVACASERVLDAYGTGGRWGDRIRASLVVLLQFLEDQPAMGRLAVVEVLGAGPKALERRARVLARMITAIDDGRREAKPGQEPPPLTAEGVVGAVFSVIHTRMLERQYKALLDLTSSLMAMIVLPYLGASAARKELARPAPKRDGTIRRATHDPLRGLEMRLTYRTVRVLMAIAAHPQASNRQVANAADVSDQGQMSKLLARLEHLKLIENTGASSTRGEPNAWTLTTTGHHIEQTIQQQTQRPKG